MNRILSHPWLTLFLLAWTIWGATVTLCHEFSPGRNRVLYWVTGGPFLWSAFLSYLICLGGQRLLKIFK